MRVGVGQLDTDVMPIFIIIALDIVITLRFSINCSTIICSPSVLFSFKREASSETYGPRVYFPSYIFISINQKTQNTLLQFIYFYFVFHFSYLLYLSLSDLTMQLTVKGMTNPLSRWVQVFDCLCRCIDWRHACASYWIDTLVL